MQGKKWASVEDAGILLCTKAPDKVDCLKYNTEYRKLMKLQQDLAEPRRRHGADEKMAWNRAWGCQIKKTTASRRQRAGTNGGQRRWKQSAGLGPNAGTPATKYAHGGSREGMEVGKEEGWT